MDGSRFATRSRLWALAFGIILAAPSAGVLALGDNISKAHADEQASATGSFGSPFAEPTINGQRTDYKCIRRAPRPGQEPSGPLYSPFWDCKPTAGSLNTLPGRSDRLLYWNALESTENINAHTFGEFGNVAVNDQSRRLELNPLNPFNSSWQKPSPVDGGANSLPEGAPDTEFVGVPNEIGRRVRRKPFGRLGNDAVAAGLGRRTSGGHRRPQTPLPVDPACRRIDDGRSCDVADARPWGRGARGRRPEDRGVILAQRLQQAPAVPGLRIEARGAAP